LEKYRPPSYLRDTRLLRRFPKRNQYISDYIFAATGTRRTAKQVSSRLQQLRDTCKDVRVLNLISRREYTPEPDAASDFSLSAVGLESPSADSAPSPPTTDTTVGSPKCSVSSAPPRTFVTIQFTSPSSFSPIFSAPSSHHDQRFLSMEYPSNMDACLARVTFVTNQKISTSLHYSYFRVLIGGVVVHSELTEVAYVSSSSVGATKPQHKYSTLIIPRLWRQLCRTADLSQCTIEQDILQTHRSFDEVPTSPLHTDRSIRAVTYTFSVSRPATPPPTFYPPALLTEPSLPPEFPSSVGHGAYSRCHSQPHVVAAQYTPYAYMADTDTETSPYTYYDYTTPEAFASSSSGWSPDSYSYPYPSPSTSSSFTPSTNSSPTSSSFSEVPEPVYDATGCFDVNSRPATHSCPYVYGVDDSPEAWYHSDPPMYNTEMLL
ncbi:hypothetical protein FB45DRAFT_1127965, partial [Roridomyces roridus]